MRFVIRYIAFIAAAFVTATRAPTAPQHYSMSTDSVTLITAPDSVIDSITADISVARLQQSM